MILFFRFLFFSLFFLTLTPFPATGQIQQKLDDLRDRQQEMEETLRRISIPMPATKASHVYLSKNWQNSCVITQNDEYFYFNGRFNVLNQGVECLVNSNVYVIRPMNIHAATIGNRIFIPVFKNGNWVYFEVLEKGKLSLLKKYTLESKMESGNSLLPSVNGEKKYYIQSELYYTTDFKSFEPLRNSKKKIFALFGKNASRVEAFMEHENLKLREETDLVKMVDYFNRLEGK